MNATDNPAASAAGIDASAAPHAAPADSVLAALSALPATVTDDDWVLVHDAARPCLALEDLDRLIAALPDERDGAILAAPMADTVKQSDDDSGRITATHVNRGAIVAAGTPVVTLTLLDPIKVSLSVSAETAIA